MRVIKLFNKDSKNKKPTDNGLGSVIYLSISIVT